MKIYYSPLFITSSLLLLFSLFLAAENLFEPESWALLIAIPLFLIATTGMFIHFVFARIIKEKPRVQFLIELALIGSALLLLFMS